VDNPDGGTTMRVEDKVAIIIGVACGIGVAIAWWLSEESALPLVIDVDAAGEKRIGAQENENLGGQPTGGPPKEIPWLFPAV